MKKLLLISFALTVSSTTKAQSLLTENANWKIVEEYQVMTQMGIESYYSYYDYSFNGTETFNDTTYHVLEGAGTDYYIREENNKVFLKYSSTSSDRLDTSSFLLYDFNLTVGDTIPLRFDLVREREHAYWRFEVIEEDSVSTVSGKHRRLRLLIIDKDSTYPSGNPLEYTRCYGDTLDWIETIGNPISLLYSLHGANCEGLGEGFRYELICHTKDDSLWYRSYETCSPNLSGKEERMKTDITVYPVPAKDYIEWKTQKPVDRIEIYDVRGQCLKSASNPGKRIALDNIPSGTYIIKAQGEKTGDVRIGKVIIE